jgi:hypothetical protein
MHDNIRHKMPIDKLITCRNQFVCEQLVLSGGTLQIVRGDWTGHVVATIQDSWGLGRWCGSKIRLKHDSTSEASLHYMCIKCMQSIYVTSGCGNGLCSTALLE